MQILSLFKFYQILQETEILVLPKSGQTLSP